MTIPDYPEFTVLTSGLKKDISGNYVFAKDGVSEFSFPGLYLFRNRYQYRISAAGGKSLVLSGIQPASGPDEETGRFFMTPCGLPEKEIIDDLFREHDYWKNIPESFLKPGIPAEDQFGDWGLEITEDRNNFDYLYLRTDLAELKGKKFHKKRNLISQFVNTYTCSDKPLSGEEIADAVKVLDRWREEKAAAGDYDAAREALELFDELDFSGRIFYVEEEPAAWCLGESMAGGTIYTIQFEKALDRYKGLYQYINRAFAASLPENIIHINREQDLGEEGLRHAKMSYRPCGFVRKYTGKKRSVS